MPNLQPGASDPYWNEWFIGLEYVLDLLDDSKGIQKVIFQAEGIQGVDDLIIVHDASIIEGIQVKYVRKETKNQHLTFSDVVKPDGKGLITSISKGWKQLNDTEGLSGKCCLLTNNTVSTIGAVRIKNGVRHEYLSLYDFWEQVKKNLDAATSISDMLFFGDMDEQWKEFIEAIDLSEHEKLSFLKSLEISSIRESFDDHIPIIHQKLITLFRCDAGIAENLYRALLAQLPTWTSTKQAGRPISRENVLHALSVVEKPDVQLAVMIPQPFLPSRETPKY